LNSAPVIEAARLRLRPHRKEDCDALHRLWSLEPVYRFGRSKPSTTEESWHRLLRYGGLWPMLGIGYWALEHRVTGQYIGEAGFADFHRDLDPPFGDRPEAGWMLDPDHWHQGLASEALTAIFARSDMHAAQSAVCMITHGNEASFKLAARFGFHRYTDATYHGDAVTLLERSPPQSF
jgi:RimJ/RimL family protein N-acetyltransferase